MTVKEALDEGRKNCSMLFRFLLLGMLFALVVLPIAEISAAASRTRIANPSAPRMLKCSLVSSEKDTDGAVISNTYRFSWTKQKKITGYVFKVSGRTLSTGGKAGKKVRTKKTSLKIKVDACLKTAQVRSYISKNRKNRYSSWRTVRLSYKKSGKLDKAVTVLNLKDEESGTFVDKDTIRAYRGSKKFFRVYKIKKGDKVYKRIINRSLPKKGYSPKNLRYVRTLYTDFSGNTCMGEIIVNKSIAKKVSAIFHKLYKNKYQIRRMKLIDDYFPKKYKSRQAAALKADENSMNADNTSAFNYRKVAGSSMISIHSYGKCIDVNPFENPWVSKSGKVASNQKRSAKYANRSKKRAHMIYKNSYITKLFRKYGFLWGGTLFSDPDYQHFQYRK